MDTTEKTMCRQGSLRRWYETSEGALMVLRIGAPLLAFVVTFMLAANIDLAEQFTEWAEANEEWEVDELPVAMLAAAVSFAVLAGLERRLYKREVERHRETEDRLRQAMDMAVRANTSKSAFLASMSHELRTPLNAIVGFSDFMRQETLGKIKPSRYLTYLDDICRSSEHLLSLIEKTLDISKIEAGKYDLRRETIPLARLAEEAGRIVHDLAAEKQLQVHYDIPDGLEIFADPQAARQILINLLNNAVKFNRSRGRVAVNSVCDSGQAVTIAVSDTGCGIDREMLEKVFEPFAQASPQRARQTTGSGLGLSIVKRLAELHGGSVSVDSWPGKGTTVSVRLPGSPITAAGYSGQAGTYCRQDAAG